MCVFLLPCAYYYTVCFCVFQKTRAESIPAFGVVPHKMLKGLRGDSSSGGLKKIVDMSAQIVVLDRKAKEMKQVGKQIATRLT